MNRGADMKSEGSTDAGREGGGHTPGPWGWSLEDESMWVLHGRDVLVDHVLAVTPCASCQKRTRETKEFNRCLGPGEANAHLIAAAPDMLAALIACEESLRLVHEALGPVPKDTPMPKYSTFGAWKRADEAIRRARGLSADATPTHSESNPAVPGRDE